MNSVFSFQSLKEIKIYRGNRRWTMLPASGIMGFLKSVAAPGGCLFEVVSSVSGGFGDPYSARAPWSSVFDGSLTGNGCPENSRAIFQPLWTSDRSRCGAVFILMVKDQGDSYAEILTRRSFVESLRRILSQRPLIEILYTELWNKPLQRSLQWILPRDLL